MHRPGSNVKNLAAILILIAALCLSHKSVTIAAAPPLSESLMTSPTISWIRQFGTLSDDNAMSIALDGAGNIYVAGWTFDTLPGQVSLGGWDAFVVKYDSSGNLSWAHQFGTSSDDYAIGIAVDSSGNIYVAGRTSGVLPGQSFSRHGESPLGTGNADAYIVKYDPTGSIAWTRQFGTAADDYAIGIDVDGSGNIYVAGRTRGDFSGQYSARYGGSPGETGGWDAFLVKYDSTGSMAWTRQIGSTADDYAFGIAVDDAENIYVAGYTYGAFPGQSSSGGWDAFLVKYDFMGSIAWTRQFGSYADDYGTRIATDSSGNIYVAGYTYGALPDQSSTRHSESPLETGGWDAFLVKYDFTGSMAWTRQFGTAADDYAFRVAVDSSENIYVAGAAGGDSFVMKCDSTGNIAWTIQFGSSADDFAYGIAVDRLGAIYVAGRTLGALHSQIYLGGYDAFLVKLVQN